jgi:N-acetylmuramic acid 6-phosphate (MurNAc-6-P) etherase
VSASLPSLTTAVAAIADIADQFGRLVYVCVLLCL